MELRKGCQDNLTAWPQARPDSTRLCSARAAPLWLLLCHQGYARNSQRHCAHSTELFSPAWDTTQPADKYAHDGSNVSTSVGFLDAASSTQAASLASVEPYKKTAGEKHLLAGSRRRLGCNNGPSPVETSRGPSSFLCPPSAAAPAAQPCGKAGSCCRLSKSPSPATDRLPSARRGYRECDVQPLR